MSRVSQFVSRKIGESAESVNPRSRRASQAHDAVARPGAGEPVRLTGGGGTSSDHSAAWSRARNKTALLKWLARQPENVELIASCVLFDFRDGGGGFFYGSLKFPVVSGGEKFHEVAVAKRGGRWHPVDLGPDIGDFEVFNFKGEPIQPYDFSHVVGLMAVSHCYSFLIAREAVGELIGFPCPRPSKPRPWKPKEPKSPDHAAARERERINAKKFAKLGCRVFPLSLAKKPRVARLDEATTDEATIDRWCEEGRFDDGLTAIRGVNVIDIDGKEHGAGIDGHASLARLESQHGPLAEGPYSITPSGLHIPVKTPGGLHNTTSEIANGIDTRGADDGYIVAPECEARDGRRWRLPPGVARRDFVENARPAPDWSVEVAGNGPNVPGSAPDAPEEAATVGKSDDRPHPSPGSAKPKGSESRAHKTLAVTGSAKAEPKAGKLPPRTPAGVAKFWTRRLKEKLRIIANSPVGKRAVRTAPSVWSLGCLAGDAGISDSEIIPLVLDACRISGLVADIGENAVLRLITRKLAHGRAQGIADTNLRIGIRWASRDDDDCNCLAVLPGTGKARPYDMPKIDRTRAPSGWETGTDAIEGRKSAEFKRIVRMLALYAAGWDKPWFIVAGWQLAGLAETTERTYWAAIDRLESNGWIVREPRQGASGGDAANFYRLTDPRKAEAEPSGGPDRPTAKGRPVVPCADRACVFCHFDDLKPAPAFGALTFIPKSPTPCALWLSSRRAPFCPEKVGTATPLRRRCGSGNFVGGALLTGWERIKAGKFDRLPLRGESVVIFATPVPGTPDGTPGCGKTEIMVVRLDMPKIRKRGHRVGDGAVTVVAETRATTTALAPAHWLQAGPGGFAASVLRAVDLATRKYPGPAPALGEAWLTRPAISAGKGHPGWHRARLDAIYTASMRLTLLAEMDARPDLIAHLPDTLAMIVETAIAAAREETIRDARNQPKPSRGRPKGANVHFMALAEIEQRGRLAELGLSHQTSGIVRFADVARVAIGPLGLDHDTFTALDAALTANGWACQEPAPDLAEDDPEFSAAWLGRFYAGHGVDMPTLKAVAEPGDKPGSWVWTLEPVADDAVEPAPEPTAPTDRQRRKIPRQRRPGR